MKSSHLAYETLFIEILACLFKGKGVKSAEAPSRLTWHNHRLDFWEILGKFWGIPITLYKTMTYTLYGIKACDTMKKARTWLDEHSVSYDFHDYKTQGIDREHLTQWCNEHGWQVVLNRAGTTFRKLDDAQKADIDQPKAIELMLAQPSMIKRPVLDLGDKTLIGFKPDLYAAAVQ